MKTLKLTFSLLFLLTSLDHAFTQQTYTGTANLLQFRATIDNNQAMLKWSTGFVTNNTMFDIERRNAGGVWHSIGTVKSGTKNGDAVDFDFTDASPMNGDNYYRLKQTDGNASPVYSTSLHVELKKGPSGSLFQNYPNPFIETTTIRYYMRRSGPVKIVVYDQSGKQIAVLANQNQAEGTYTVNWNGRDLPPGSYIYKIVTDDDNITQKMIKAK